jgi:hypothetical protein
MEPFPVEVHYATFQKLFRPEGHARSRTGRRRRIRVDEKRTHILARLREVESLQGRGCEVPTRWIVNAMHFRLRPSYILGPAQFGLLSVSVWRPKRNPTC